MHYKLDTDTHVYFYEPVPHEHTWKRYASPLPCGCVWYYCSQCLNPQLPAHDPDCPYGPGEDEGEGDEPEEEETNADPGTDLRYNLGDHWN